MNKKINKRSQILKWQQQGLIKKQDLDKSLTITNTNLTSENWHAFVSKSLIYLGSAAFALGVLFFFAFNWDKMPVFVKFSLLQLQLLFFGFIFLKTQSKNALSTGLLLLVLILIGALFALIGQTYQTGKDPWQLFFYWTVFALPLAYISQSNILWFAHLVLANLSMILFFDVNNVIFSMRLNNSWLALIMAGFNFIMAVVFFKLQNKHIHFNTKFLYQVAIIIALIYMTNVAVAAAFNFKYGVIPFLLYLLVMAVIYFFFRIKNLNVLILSAWSVSVITTIMFGLGNILDENINAIGFLILSITLIGLSTITTKWLMKLNRLELGTES